MKLNNAKSDKLCQGKDFATCDTSYSSFWFYNSKRDFMSKHFQDSFVRRIDVTEFSEFNPAVAKNIISYWSEKGNKILDPFAGRTRGFVASAMGRNYVGFEVSEKVCNYLNEKAKDIIEFKPRFINDDCLNIDISCKKEPAEQADLIFSCPPYFNLEKYESCPGQLTDIKEYSQFMWELCLRLEVALDYLKSGGYMILVVGDFRKNGQYITFHSDLIQHFSAVKEVMLHDIIVVQNIPLHIAAYHFGPMRKVKKVSKAHEYILVYKKT